MHARDAADYRANSSMQLVMARRLLDQIAVPPDARVLDVGCGDGKVTALIHAASVTGCDRSPEMIDLARRELHVSETASSARNGRSGPGRTAGRTSSRLPLQTQGERGCSGGGVQPSSDAVKSRKRGGSRETAQFPGDDPSAGHAQSRAEP